MADYFPYKKIGLNCNPFRVLAPDELAEYAVLPDDIREAWDNGAIVQIIGIAGSGKSTTLRALHRHILKQDPNAILEYLPVDCSYFTTKLDGLSVYCLDEAQRLKPKNIRKLTEAISAGNMRLAFTSHVNLQRYFINTGAPLYTSYADKKQPEFIKDLLNTRISLHSLQNPPYPYLNMQTVDLLYTRFGNNIRAMEWLLYESFQHLSVHSDSITEWAEGITVHLRQLIAQYSEP